MDANAKDHLRAARPARCSWCKKANPLASACFSRTWQEEGTPSGVQVKSTIEGSGTGEDSEEASVNHALKLFERITVHGLGGGGQGYCSIVLGRTVDLKPWVNPDISGEEHDESSPSRSSVGASERDFRRKQNTSTLGLREARTPPTIYFYI